MDNHEVETVIRLHINQVKQFNEILKFTDDEINRAKTSDDGYIGTHCGCKCYLIKKIPKN